MKYIKLFESHSLSSNPMPKRLWDIEAKNIIDKWVNGKKIKFTEKEINSITDNGGLLHKFDRPKIFSGTKKDAKIKYWEIFLFKSTEDWKSGQYAYSIRSLGDEWFLIFQRDRIFGNYYLADQLEEVINYLKVEKML